MGKSRVSWSTFTYVSAIMFSLCCADSKKLLIEDQLCPVELTSVYGDGSHGCQPTVGRWGNEWPSWLDNATECIQNLTRVGGEWPKGHPLPLPRWGYAKHPLFFNNVEEYEELARFVESKVQGILQTHNYNTIGNFVRWVSLFRYINSCACSVKVVDLFGNLCSKRSSFD